MRSEVQVGGCHLRRLFWTRPLSEAHIAQAAARIVEHDEDRALLDSAVKASDGFFTTFFVSPYSKYMARWAARRGWTPNGVTTISVAVGFLAAAGFATGERWGMIAGALLLQLAFTLDCVDGQLARYTRTFTKLGAWLDSIFDRTKEYAVFAGLAIGASQTGDDVWLLAGAALTLQVMRHSIDFSYPQAQHQVMGLQRQPPLEQVADGIGAAVPVALVPEGEPQPESPAPPPPPQSLAKRLRGGWRALDRSSRAVWVKKIIGFPIGERFAAISLTAALFDARATFIVLLAWGGFAAAYSAAGRVLRSLGRRGSVVLDRGAPALAGHARRLPRRRAARARAGPPAAPRRARLPARAGRRRAAARADRDHRRRRVLAARRRGRGVARAGRRRLGGPAPARPPPLGRAAGAARRRVRRAAVARRRSPARRPCRPPSPCCSPSPTATTTWSTGCGTAA